jgi:type I restriction enzyme S subunit
MRLGDVCTKITDGSHNPPQGISHSEYLMLSSKNIYDGEITLDDPRFLSAENYAIENKRTQIATGDILLTIVGTVGRAAVVPDSIKNICLQRSVAVIKPKSDLVDSRFLMYQLQSMRTHLEHEARGVAQKGIYLKQVENLQIKVPSLDEQLRVVKKLDKVSVLIALRKEQLAKLDQLIKSRFIELFGGISDSKQYPYKAVKDLTDVISGGTPSRDVNEYWEGGTIPWVKTTELQNNIITEIDEHITEAGLDNSSAKLVPAGTVLIAMYGQGKTRGMTGYLGVEACTNQACACILPSDRINQKFLWQFFVLSYDNLRDMAKGGNQPNLNGNIIKNYPVLYPPMELQEQFATFVEQTDKSKLAIQQSLDKLELLKKSLMQEYFG